MNKIYVVGIGPGGCDQMTGIAMNALKDSDTIIGYTVYVDLVKDTFPDKEYLTTPMKKEVDRCVLAFEEAMKGKRVSMICSGDAGDGRSFSVEMSSEAYNTGRNHAIHMVRPDLLSSERSHHLSAAEVPG